MVRNTRLLTGPGFATPSAFGGNKNWIRLNQVTSRVKSFPKRVFACSASSTFVTCCTAYITSEVDSGVVPQRSTASGHYRVRSLTAASVRKWICFLYGGWGGCLKICVYIWLHEATWACTPAAAAIFYFLFFFIRNLGEYCL